MQADGAAIATRVEPDVQYRALEWPSPSCGRARGSRPGRLVAVEHRSLPLDVGDARPAARSTSGTMYMGFVNSHVDAGAVARCGPSSPTCPSRTEVEVALLGVPAIDRPVDRPAALRFLLDDLLTLAALPVSAFWTVLFENGCACCP